MIFFSKIGGKRVFVYGILFLGLAAVLSSPFLLERISNTAYMKNKIFSLIYQKTGVHIDVSNFSISVFPKISINIDNFIVTPSKTAQVTIDSLKFGILAQELLKGQITIGQITIDHPRITTQHFGREKSMLPGDFSVSDYLQALSTLFDRLPEHQPCVEILFTNVTSPYFRRTEGSLFVSKEKKEIVLHTTIKDLAVNSKTIFSPSFETAVDVDSIAANQIKTILTFDSQKKLHGHCTLFGTTLKSSDNYTVFDSSTIESTFTLSDGGCQIDIKPVKLTYPKGSVALHFEDDQSQKKTDIQFIGSNIHIDQAKEMSLRVFKDNEITKNIFEILKTGLAPSVIVSFHHNTLKTLFDADNLFLSGKIETGTIKIPETRLIVDHLYADARIQKGVLDITATGGRVKTSKIEKGSFRIDLLNYTDYPFNGEFFLDLDLSMVPDTLKTVFPDTLLARELSLVHDVSGNAKSRLTLSMETQSTDLNIGINTDDFSVTGTYDRIPGSLYLENIQFGYEMDRVSLKHLNGVMNGSKIYDLNAFLDFKKDPWINIQSGSGMLFMKSIFPWIMSYEKTKKKISPVQYGSGKVFVTSVTLDGPLLKPDLWKYGIKGTGEKIDLTTNLNQKQIENLSCQYNISHDHLDINTIETKIHSLSWMTPYIETKHLDSILTPFALSKGRFYADPKLAFFKTTSNFNNGLRLSLDLNGKTPTSLALSKIHFFDPGISKGSIAFNPDKSMPLLDFYGNLNTATVHKFIAPKSFWAKKIDGVTEGQPIILHRDKDGHLTINIKNINLNSIVSQSENISTKTRDRLFSNEKIHFKADTLKINPFTIKDIDSIVCWEKDHSCIKLNKAFLCNLEAKGTIDLKKDVLSVTLPVEAKHTANIQELLTCLFQKNDFMTGQYSLNSNLQSKGTRTQLLHKISGPVHFTAEKGRIYKLTLLSRILSVLNVSKIFKGSIPDIVQEGFGYSSIFIEADIKESVIHLTKAIIDGQDMTLMFSGWIDPVNDKIDLTCLVAPFKTIDLIVEHIPIINELLGGRLVSIPVKASGPLTDPVVIPMHPSAVGKGLINMMSTILKTPVTLWDKIYSD